MLSSFIEFVFKTLTNPDKLIEFLTTVMTGWYGYALLFGIVFAETGLLVGFFLPGDSLLFTVGMVAGAGHLDVVTIILLLTAAAIIGDGVGYFLGRKAGPLVFSRPNSRLFRKEHLQRTREFYEKHGGKAIVYARFVPIIRTFAPFVAGVGNMNYQRFLSFNVFGGIGWVALMTMLGYWLGGWEVVRRNFEKVILGIIFISVMPIVFEYFKNKKNSA